MIFPSLEECNMSLYGTALNTCGLSAERFYRIVNGRWDGKVFGRCLDHPVPREWLETTAGGFEEVTYFEAAVQEVHRS